MSCHLSMNLMELVVALTTQLDFCQKNENSLGSFQMLYFYHDVDIREVDFYSRS
jgi:hypothetical protein